MSIDEITQFKLGQIFYENSYGESVRFELITRPFFDGDELHFQGRTKRGDVDFMIHRKYPHYGPDISLEPKYESIEEISKWKGRLK